MALAAHTHTHPQKEQRHLAQLYNLKLGQKEKPHAQQEVRFTVPYHECSFDCAGNMLFYSSVCLIVSRKSRLWEGEQTPARLDGLQES